MSETSTTLTIGIPTFNRRDTVARRLDELLAIMAKDRIEILVIDNASTDDTYNKLTSEYARPGVRVLQNTSNLGYAGNLLRLVEEVETDFLLVLSDEDYIEQPGLEAIYDFCVEKRPNFISPRASVGGDDSYRGRTKTREMAPSDFESSSFYISGLTFKSSVAKRLAPSIKERLATNSAASVYPQVLLAALAIAEGECFFVDELVSTQVEQLDTHIVERSGGEYYSVEGRWAQFRGYEEFFSDMVRGTEGQTQLHFEQMRNQAHKQLLSLLTSAAISEFPELSPYLRRSIARQTLDAIRALVAKR